MLVRSMYNCSLTLPVNTLFFLVCVVIYKCLLVVLYTNFVSPVFEYAGFLYEESYQRFLISWLVYLPLTTLLKSDYHKPSDFYLFIHFLLIMTPTIVLFEAAGKSVVYMLLTIVSFLLIKLITCLPDVKIPRFSHGNIFSVTVSSVLLIFVVLRLINVGGMQINFSLEQVYTLREETKFVYFGGVWGYVTSWAFKVSMPFLLAVSLLNKNYYLSIGILFLGILAFGVTGHRSMALFAFVVIGIFATRNFREKNTKILIAIMFFLSLIYSMNVVFGDIVVSSTIIRRAFFLPSFLNYTYFEFFADQDFVLYSNSVLAGLSAYPYGDVSIPQMVGWYGLGERGMSANTGFLGSAYAHGGVTGVLVISVGVGMVLKAFDSVGRSDPNVWFYVAFSIIPVLAMLTSSAFFTALLTQGVMFALLITSLYRID